MKIQNLNEFDVHNAKKESSLNIVVVGTQWGDEGKGRVIDLLASKMDVVVRYQGGSNAGHTVIVNNEKFVFHLMPSGILYPGKIVIIANGVVIEPGELLKEMEDLKKKHIAIENLFISDNAHVVMPYHKDLEKQEENMRGKGKIGTTGRGIGPAYADKIARKGIRMGDLLEKEILEAKLATNLEIYRNLLGYDYSQKQILAELLEYGEFLRKYITDTSLLIYKLILEGKDILFEGAQGTLLDIDHGTYPYVTSSNSTAGGVCSGTGIGPGVISKVVGVAKAYTTRVGEGPFPTEMKGEIGDLLRKQGNEFGATTGRPRRCGWFDGVALRYAVRINGLNELTLTKLDVLDNLETVKICTAYKCKDDLIHDFPNHFILWKEYEPVYEEMEGWKQDTSKVTSYKGLPRAAQNYIKRIEAIGGVPIRFFSVGPQREEMLTTQ